MDGDHPRAPKWGFNWKRLQRTGLLHRLAALILVCSRRRRGAKGRRQALLLHPRPRLAGHLPGMDPRPGEGVLPPVQPVLPMRADYTMTKVRVDGFRHGRTYLLSCSVCGPLGCSESYAVGVAEVRLHLRAHGVTDPVQTVSDQED